MKEDLRRYMVFHVIIVTIVAIIDVFFVDNDHGSLFLAMFNISMWAILLSKLIDKLVRKLNANI